MSQAVFTKTKLLRDIPTHYCPGCTHGIIHRLVGEAIEELGMEEKTIGINSVGCSGLMFQYFLFDQQCAAHGRAPAVATGAKRVNQDCLVFTYQGDGDLGAIGNAEANHAAIRGEKLTTILVNNAIYGMTGGQMAPTTLPGQRSTTTQHGRDVEMHGYPLRAAEMIATHEGTYYAERVSLHDTANILKAKKAITKAFRNQKEGKGFNFVEVLSTCPTNWGKNPLESLEWLKENMIPYYPLGVLKDKDAK